MVVAVTFSFVHAVHASPLRVALAFEQEHELYRSFEAALHQAFESRTDINLLPNAAGVREADVIIAVGAKAAERYIDSPRPVLNVLVSRAWVDSVGKPDKRQISGIYFDQPIDRQLALLHAALPQARSVGVLVSADSAALQSLRRLSDETRISLHVQQSRMPDRLFGDLSALLGVSDALLVLPDAAIYRSDTIRNILLETYRQRVPMIGLSQHYVRAGALCAVYSTPLQIANQTARAVAQFAKTGKLPDYQYPQEFEVAVNTQVARSLGLTIKSAEQLRTEIGGGP